MHVLAVPNVVKTARFFHEEMGFDIEPVADKPWGMREFLIETPDGHRIMFGQDISSPDISAFCGAADIKI